MIFNHARIAYCIYIITTLITLQYAYPMPYEAITCQPVVDLLGQSMRTITSQPVEHAYRKVPICSTKTSLACPRVHQLLLHERVTVIDQTRYEVCIRVPHIFFNKKNDSSCNTIFWTLKKNVIPLTFLEKKGINIATLPPALSFEKKDNGAASVVTLIQPYTDAITGRTFSAGTRFVCKPQSPRKNTYIDVYALHPSLKKTYITQLPANIVISSQQPLSGKEKRARFVSILRTWAHDSSPDCIPYVWGGCSFVAKVPEKPYCTKTGVHGDYYQRPTYGHQAYGFDCAGIIVRAAQIAQLPYFFKNTITIAQHLRPLTGSDSIQEGDIIWFQGHVMVISSLANNTIIEARHYNHGFGKIHEIPIHTVFKNIHTFDDLLDAYHTKAPLYRLDSNQEVAQRIQQFKILSLASIGS